MRKFLALLLLLSFAVSIVGCEASGKVDKHGVDADVHGR